MNTSRRDRKGAKGTHSRHHPNQNWVIKSQTIDPQEEECSSSLTSAKNLATVQEPFSDFISKPRTNSKKNPLLKLDKKSGDAESCMVEERKLDSNKSHACADKAGKQLFSQENSEKSHDCADKVEDDFWKRLQLGTEEPQLSPQQLEINDQAQQDELLVLESMYGDNIFILDRQNGLRSFQIHVHVEVPDELVVNVNLRSSGLPEESSPAFAYSFKVEHLPPIVLTCLLPNSYPSHLAPHFKISVQWLNSAKISSLCSMLDSIWKEQLGQEVIYQWVEWLQGSSLSHLQFDQAITLEFCGKMGYIGDSRAISGSVSPEIDVPSLKSYDEEQRHDDFRRNLHQCCICFSEFPGMEFVRLPCQHFFCCNCMRTFSDIHVKEGTISKLVCPEAKCGGMIPPGLLKQLLGEVVFERWESMMLKKTLESMSDVCYCPRCETVCIEDEDGHAQCAKCFFSFCTLCWDKRHVGVACMSLEMKLHILQERQKSCQMKVDQMHREKDMINEILNMREIHRSSKLCPTCKMAISRTEGCNKMTCDNCRTHFCYKCNQSIDEYGYEHFREGKCTLFPPEVIQMWHERNNGRHVLGHEHAQRNPNRHPCPMCRQMNAKVMNNNHILCYVCQHHYCYLCRKPVKQRSQHFGPKGCKQHTPG